MLSLSNSLNPHAAAAAARVLYLDHDGGFGGAGRSLRFLVSSIDRTRFVPTIWCRKPGPLEEYLKSEGLEFAIDTNIFNFTPRSASNPKNWIVSAPAIARLWSVARRIAKHDHDLLHLNLEGFVPISLLLDRLGDTRPRVLHVRTMNFVNNITRYYVRHVSHAFQHVFFISENELDRFVRSGFDRCVPHTVLPNPMHTKAFDVTHDRPATGPFRISYFGSLDEQRAPDRLIPVARLLREQKVNVRIDIFGRNPSYRKWLLWTRQNDLLLQQMIDEAGVSEIVRLCGHTEQPDREMASSDLIIRPSRLSDPWGRDVIKSMSVGTPILASGDYQGFIKHGETGVLVEPWSAEVVADWVMRLANDQGLRRRLGSAAGQRARDLFDPARYAARIEKVYNDILLQSGWRYRP